MQIKILRGTSLYITTDRMPSEVRCNPLPPVTVSIASMNQNHAGVRGIPPYAISDLRAINLDLRSFLVRRHRACQPFG